MLQIRLLILFTPYQCKIACSSYLERVRIIQLGNVSMQNTRKRTEHGLDSAIIEHLQPHAHRRGPLYLVHEVRGIATLVEHYSDVHPAEHSETRPDTRWIGLFRY